VVFRSLLDPVSWLAAWKVANASDTLHGFTHLGNFLALGFARKGQRIVCTVTGLGRLWCGNGMRQRVGRQVVLWGYRILLRRADAILFQNSDDLSEFRKRVLSRPGLPQMPTYLTPGSGVDVDACGRVARAAKREGRALRIGFFSRADELKGVGIFYEVAARLAGRHEFIHAGHHGKGRYSREGIEELARVSGVRYLGVLEEPLACISSCDLVLLPTMYREGVPRLLLECFALGVPAICFAGPGIDEHVDHGVNSFIAKDAEDMISVIEAMTLEKLAAISEAQTKYASDILSVDNVNRIYFESIGLK
jgi:glycosyltransferase involved in cell wall biosynthesis